MRALTVSIKQGALARRPGGAAENRPLALNGSDLKLLRRFALSVEPANVNMKYSYQRVLFCATTNIPCKIHVMIDQSVSIV